MSVLAEPITTQEHSRARWAMVALAANAVLAAISVLLDVAELGLLTNAQASGTASTIDEALEDPLLSLVWLFEVGVAILQLVALLASIVFFLMWIYRAHKNLLALGARKQDLRFSPGWAVGVFFIPLVNLVLPFLAVREIWKASAASLESREVGSWKKTPTPLLLTMWWATSIIGSILGRIASRLPDVETLGGAINSAWVSLMTDLATTIAAVLAIFVVRGIDALQSRSL
jgi:hypothetical protein